MSGLVTGFTMSTIVKADDRKVLGLGGGDGGKAAEIHQELAVPGHHHDIPRSGSKRHAEADHARGPHGAAEREKVVAVVRQRSAISRRPREALN
jgi:hypothetical protein